MILPESEKLAQLRRDLETVCEKLAECNTDIPFLSEKLEAASDRAWEAIAFINTVIAAIDLNNAIEENNG